MKIPPHLEEIVKQTNRVRDLADSMEEDRKRVRRISAAVYVLLIISVAFNLGSAIYNLQHSCAAVTPG